LLENASIINHDPYGEGWIAKIKLDNQEELATLMSAKDYAEYRKE